MLNCKEVSQLASDHLDQAPQGWQGLQLRMHWLICRHCRRFRRHLVMSRDCAATLATQLWSQDRDSAQRMMQRLSQYKPPPEQ